MSLYDPVNHCLVLCNENADSSFWDNKWQEEVQKVKYDSEAVVKKDRVYKITSKYLVTGSKVLEGGCGLAQHSWNLYHAGYDMVALDYTPRTIEYLFSKIPQVKPVLGDVRKLKFKDNTFDGYWSIGVIEHFSNGYSEIAEEMYRVIKPEKYLFLSFPCFNLFRQIKAKMGFYKQIKEFPYETFYQYMLNIKKVKKDFKEYGFELVDIYMTDAAKGLKDESLFLKNFLNIIYNSDNKFFKLMIRMINLLGNPLFSHSCILVLKKKGKYG